jgi:hypothetical protein|tara:strand:+ start:433 stop:747 length:315 start_codon:yes stop_codon:yes gene_type:complete
LFADATKILDKLMEYFLMGVLSPVLLNLLHLTIGIYIVLKRGNIYSLGFTAISFITKTIGLLFLTWIGVGFLGLNFKIYIPMLTFFWFVTHILEAFVIQGYLKK